MYKHITNPKDPLYLYAQHTNMQGSLNYILNSNQTATDKNSIRNYDCLWTPYVNYALFNNLHQDFLVYNDTIRLSSYNDNPIPTRYDLIEAINYTFSSAYRNDIFEADTEKTKISLFTIITTKNDIENFANRITADSKIQEEENYERMLLTNIKHSVKIYTCKKEFDKQLQIVVLSNSINPEFLIRTTLLSTILIKQNYYQDLQWDTKIIDKLNNTLEYAKNNPEKSMNELYEIMDILINLKEYKQYLKQETIKNLSKDYKNQLMNSVTSEIDRITRKISQYYTDVTDLQEKKQIMLQRLLGIKQEEDNANAFNILGISPAIEDLIIWDRSEDYLVLDVTFKVPLNNIDYAQFRRQYERITDKNSYYQGCQKEIKALLIDKSYTLIVKQTVRFKISQETIKVQGHQRCVATPEIRNNDFYPFNPHIECYDCWGDAMLQIMNYNTLNQLDDLVPVVSAAVSNLNVGDSTVMSRFIEQLEILKTIAHHNDSNDTKCIIKTDTNEKINYAQFLQELEKGETNE